MKQIRLKINFFLMNLIRFHKHIGCYLMMLLGDAAERPFVCSDPDVRRFTINIYDDDSNTSSKDMDTINRSGLPDNILSEFRNQLNVNELKSLTFNDVEDTLISRSKKDHENKKKNDGNIFIISATDGLWDVFSSQEAVNFIEGVLMYIRRKYINIFTEKRHQHNYGGVRSSNKFKSFHRLQRRLGRKEILHGMIKLSCISDQ